jgi:hypothetical protein
MVAIPLACSDQGSSPTEPLSTLPAVQPTASFAQWTAKVTGGGMSFNINSCNVLFQNVSATGFNGAARGQVQITTYLGSGTYPNCVADEIWFQYHAAATDLVLGNAPDGSKVANVCYDVTKIQHPAPMPLNMRFGIAIKEGGKGSGDMTRRALNVTCLPGEFWGDDPGEGFGAVMMDGNYNIRER